MIAHFVGGGCGCSGVQQQKGEAVTTTTVALFHLLALLPERSAAAAAAAASSIPVGWGRQVPCVWVDGSRRCFFIWGFEHPLTLYSACRCTRVGMLLRWWWHRRRRTACTAGTRRLGLPTR